MLTFKQKVGAAVATASMLATVFTPVAFADTTIDISGNDDGSTNLVSVKNKCKTKVDQTNNSYVTTTVHSTASTGGNNANGNTGGSVNINTGAASSIVTVENHGSSNTAEVNPCCCDQQNSNLGVTVSGNGIDSTNTVRVKKKNRLKVYQTNNSEVSTDVWSKAKTGKNNANGNTGSGVGITTDDASSDVTVHTWQPTNTLNP